MGVNAEMPGNGASHSLAKVTIVFLVSKSPGVQENRPIGARIMVLNFERGRRSRWG